MRFFSTFLLAAVVVAAAAEPVPEPAEQPTRTLSKRSHILPFNVDHPGATPAFLAPADPILLPVTQLVLLLTATTAGPLSTLGKSAADLLNSVKTLNINGVVKTVSAVVPNLLCSLLGCATQPVTDARPVLTNMGTVTCLDSSNNATVINSLFYYGGAGTTVYLCPNADIKLEGPIFFSAANQTLTTNTLLDNQRAKLTIANTASTCAVFGAYAGLDRCTLSNVEIDGARPALGWDGNGLALIEMGGSNSGQTIKNVKVYEPRGWSAMHLLEGTDNSCSAAVVEDNDIGPSGNAPTGPAQFRRRKRGTTYTPGQWADGISLACQGSTVTGNTITDATDGGIVIFGAPNSKVQGNTIVQESRVALGGINAVDYQPFLGNFGGVVVSGNTFNAKSTMMKVGIAAGPSTWGSGSAALNTFGGSYSSNTFTSGSKGYFGYGISVSGHKAGTFKGNNFVNANFGGILSASCSTPMPERGPTVYNPVLSIGNVYQVGFVPAPYTLAICTAPGKITSTGVSYLGTL
ncbi:hypothetical protein JCM8547_003692 [Rhodosporidiobolus lusitaniae]